MTNTEPTAASSENANAENTPKPLTYILVNDRQVKVESREAARAIHMGKETTLKTVDAILLADGTVLFQCMHPDGPSCTYIAETPLSVLSHQRSHRTKPTTRELTKELNAVTAELEDRKQRASDRATKAAATRATRTSAPIEIGRSNVNDGKGKGNGGAKPIGDIELAKAAQRVITSFNALRDAEDEFQNVLIGYMRMAQTATEVPQIDPAIVAKAKKWDAYLEFQKLINDK